MFPRAGEHGYVLTAVKTRVTRVESTESKPVIAWDREETGCRGRRAREHRRDLRRADHSRHASTRGLGGELICSLPGNLVTLVAICSGGHAGSPFELYRVPGIAMLVPVSQVKA